MIGIHINLLTVPRDRPASAQPTAEEQRYAEDLAVWLKEETGYQAIQGTRPQTLAFGLTDSPAGLAAWIVEKFRAWSDCAGVPENAISRDRMLGNIALYWFTGAIGSSFWPYYARMHAPWPIPPGASFLGREDVSQHPALDADATRRALRGDGAAGAAGRGNSGVLPAVAVAAGLSAITCRRDRRVDGRDSRHTMFCQIISRRKSSVTHGQILPIS
jgi:hypothetical protein